MATFDMHKENQQVVLQLNELFGDKLHIDIIETVAKSCQFDVHQSSNELIEISNAGCLRNNAPKYVTINSSPVNNGKKTKKSFEIEKTIREINDGFKVLILLRGLPGSGKSTLAKSILHNTIGYNDETAKKHILSTDNFFERENGAYEHNPSQIGEAHGWNHQRAFNVMSKGYSPVIIDNTNTQMWEMKPYAIMATDYGYILEILEPDTHWCFNDKELEKRNKHDVPRKTIKSMLDRYQKNVTPMKLLTAYDCKYKLQKPPQYRLHPPLSQVPSEQIYTNFNGINNFKPLNLPQTIMCPNPFNKKETTNFMDFNEPLNFKSTPSPTNRLINIPAQSSSVDDILMHSDASVLEAPVLKPMHTTKVKPSSSLFDNINAWGVDEMALRSWDIVAPLKENEVDDSPIVIDDDDDDDNNSDVIDIREMSTNTDDQDFYISRNILNIPAAGTLKVLNTCNRDINRDTFLRPLKIRQKIMIDQSCLTEDFSDDYNSHLLSLSWVFPNVAQNTIKYWYQKCNRDFDCTMELLLAEKDEFINVIDEKPSESAEDTNNMESFTVDSDSGSSASETPITSQRTKHKRKNNSSSSDESQDLKKCIESKVTIADNHYSEKLLKIKQRHSQGFSNNVVTSLEAESPKALNSPAPAQTEVDENKLCFDDIEFEEPSPKSDYDEDIETMELNLGDHFVKQLEDTFGDPNLIYPKGFQPVVQMPVALARQLYTFYVESVYQQMDAHNSIMDDLVKEDEEFARKLQQTEENTANIPEEVRPPTEPFEIPDIMKEQRDLAKCKREADKWKEDTPDTLAARLTREKLFNSFPLVNKGLLIEILHAHDNVYKDTVETLLANTSPGNVHGNIETIMDSPINAVIVKEMWEAHNSCNAIVDQQDAACAAINYREEANQYLERRKTMYEKAQRHYQNGMKDVAQYYSGLASKQTRLYEQANSLAATAFLDEHSKRLEDFNTLDLHFLYVKEAIPHLDIFLDRNINLVRLSTSKSSECLQIITGRGKNSKRGVPKIKPAVINRLNERKIRYLELNPGLLKIKITNVSKVTSEL